MMTDIRRYESIDPDLVTQIDTPCWDERCSLEKGHDGPHAEVHPYSGRVFDTWGGEEDPAEAISDEALDLAQKINRIRDDIIDSLEEVEELRRSCGNGDSVVKLMAEDSEIWPSSLHVSGRLYDSGFGEGREDGLRKELYERYCCEEDTWDS